MPATWKVHWFSLGSGKCMGHSHSKPKILPDLSTVSFFSPSVTSKWWTAEVLFPWDMNLCSTSCDSRIQSTFPCIIKLILFLLLYLLKGICSHRDNPDFCFGISWKFKTGRIFPHINEYFNQYWTPDILFISPTLIYFCLWVLYQTHKGNKAWVGRLQMNIFELYLERKPLWFWYAHVEKS